MHTLEEKIRARDFVITTELTPPKGTDLSELIARVQGLHASVDAVNLTESPRALMSVAPVAVAKQLLDRGVETIVQMTSRDRNRIAIQADLLGAALLGLRNFVFMGGDPPGHGDHPDAKPVFDLTASQMVAAACELTRGRDMAGNRLKGAPQLFIGATINPGATDAANEVTNTRRKIDAGAQFLQTQAVYEATDLQQFLAAARTQEVAVIVGIIPLKSAKMAAWLNEKVPGIRVPQGLIDQMQAAAGTEAELETGLAIAARTIAEARSLCAGAHIMALGWEAHIPEILRRAGVRR
jgi:methylenetetrahydrofolate reductase (NADPH)